MYLLHGKKACPKTSSAQFLVERKENLFRKNISKNDRFRRWENITKYEQMWRGHSHVEWPMREADTVAQEKML